MSSGTRTLVIRSAGLLILLLALGSALLPMASHIPARLVIGLLLVVYVPFLRSLPRRTFRLMLLSGAIYVGGAIGMEMVGGYAWDRHPVRGVPIIAIMALEETLEMVGLAIFAYALLDYVARHFPAFGVRIGDTTI